MHALSPEDSTVSTFGISVGFFLIHSVPDSTVVDKVHNMAINVQLVCRASPQ